MCASGCAFASALIWSPTPTSRASCWGLFVTICRNRLRVSSVVEDRSEDLVDRVDEICPAATSLRGSSAYGRTTTKASSRGSLQRRHARMLGAPRSAALLASGAIGLLRRRVLASLLSEENRERSRDPLHERLRREGLVGSPGVERRIVGRDLREEAWSWCRGTRTSGGRRSPRARSGGGRRSPSMEEERRGDWASRRP